MPLPDRLCQLPTNSAHTGFTEPLESTATHRPTPATCTCTCTCTASLPWLINRLVRRYFSGKLITVCALLCKADFVLACNSPDMASMLCATFEFPASVKSPWPCLSIVPAVPPKPKMPV